MSQSELNNNYQNILKLLNQLLDEQKIIKNKLNEILNKKLINNEHKKFTGNFSEKNEVFKPRSLGLSKESVPRSLSSEKSITKKINLSFFPKQFLFDLIKYNPNIFCKYLLQLKFSINWEELYYFFYKTKNIPSVYLYPSNHKNIWLDAIINRNLNSKIIRSQKIKDRNYYLKKKIKNVVKVFRNIILLKNKTIMVFGNNKCGQLGLGDENDRQEYEIVYDKNSKPIKNVYKVFENINYNFLLLENGTVMASGANHCSQLGLINRRYNKFEFICDDKGNKIENIVNIFQVHLVTILLLRNGKILGSGNNLRGQFGTNNFNNIFRFINLRDNNNKIINDVSDIFFTGRTTIIMLNNGIILGSGENNFGQLGLGHNQIVQNFTTIYDPEKNNGIKPLYIFTSGKWVIIILNDMTAIGSGNIDYKTTNTFEFKPIKSVRLRIFRHNLIILNGKLIKTKRKISYKKIVNLIGENWLNGYNSIPPELENKIIFISRGVLKLKK